LFITPFWLNQLEDHFVVSSALPLNSSSNTRFQLPPTPTGPPAVAGAVLGVETGAAGGGAGGGGVVGVVGVGGIVEVGGAGVVEGVGDFEPVMPFEPVVPVDVFEPVEVVEVVEVLEAVGVVAAVTGLSRLETLGAGELVAAVGAFEVVGAAGLGEEVPCGDPPVGWAAPSTVRRRIETPRVGRVRRPTARTVMEPPVTGIRTEILALRRYRLVVAYRSSGPMSSRIRLRLVPWLEIAMWTA